MGNELRGVGGYQLPSYDSLNVNNNVRTNQAPDQNSDDLPSIDVILQDQSQLNSATGTKGRVPSSGVSFNQTSDQPQQLENQNTVAEDDLPDLESLKVASPQQGQSQVNSNSDDDLPELGRVEKQEPLPEEDDYKGKASKDHSHSKVLAHLESYGANKFITGVTTRYVTNATEKAVTAELTQVLSTVAVKKVAAKASATVGEKITAGATEGMLKTVASMTGKGVMPVGVREAAIASGNLVKGLEESAYAAGEILLKDGIKSLPKNTAQALVKTGIGSGEKLISTSMKTGTETAVKKVLTTAGEQVTGKVATKTLQKQASQAVEKATVEVAAKGGTKVALKVAKAMPYINAAVGTAITVWDAKDAIEKTNDKKASTASKVLAWGTVTFDAVSTVTSVTGKGKPIGWAATVLSVGTSLASDYVR